MTRKEAWDELKETIIEMRNNDGTGTQQETCKFLVNFIDVLEKQIIDKWIPEPYVPDINDGKIAIKAIKQEPCEDCISRQAVINHICEVKECYKDDCKGRIYKRCFDLQWIYDLPPVTPYKTESEEEK